ncbi:MAG: replication-associated recombination protein A [Candidatus Xenobia bacterium]
MSEPLAARMRARTLDEYLGQQQIVGAGSLLRRAIESDRLFSSIILWGPPGTGKTTLATIIANSTQSHFATLSAVLAGVGDIRKVIAEAKALREQGTRTILLVDEIHRFNKAQQDALLPHVEDGTIVLIGATTENPFFEIIGPLVSRSRIFRLQPLAPAEVRILLERALRDPDRGYGARELTVDPEALDFIAEAGGGDARTSLNALELAVESTSHVTLEVAHEALQRRTIRYDAGGDEHYDTISAFIKSVRGSDPDAALFWLAKMLTAGEDPEFIMRRLLILAGEDIGMANPHGITVASACAQALQYVGLPEAKYHLSLATVYLATSPKSNSMTQYFEVEAAIGQGADTTVPIHLRDAHYKGAKRLGHGNGYQYPHAFPGHHVAQQYLPDKLHGRVFYQPSDQGYEKTVRERMALWRTPRT